MVKQNAWFMSFSGFRFTWIQQLIKFAIQLILCIAVVPSEFAYAADFFHESASEYSGGESISIRGEIRLGDFDRFKEFLLVNTNLKAYTNRIWLNSPGGSVSEAMKFAVLFDKSSASVFVGPGSKCYSACFTMYAGGVNRTLSPFGELGVHRVSLSELETDLGKGKALVAPVAQDVYNYFLSQGIPRAIVDKMMETPATDIFKIDMQMLIRSGWYRAMSDQPTFFDTVEKACGRFPDAYPTKSILEQSRDEQTEQYLKKWVDCKISLQTKNTYAFLKSEYELLKQRRNSRIFPMGKLQEAHQALSILFAIATYKGN